MRRWNVAITGFGRVGKAVAALLLSRRARYQALYEADVRLTAICGSRAGSINDDGLGEGRLAENELTPGLSGITVLASAPVDVLIEAGPTDFRTGGPGYGYIKAALAAGRHAIAISKGALVFDGRGLRALAERNEVSLKISGATAAALPTIDLLEYNLAGCEVLRVEGILNATSNHLLTAMAEQGLDFAEALRRAQRAGIAEADPSFDTGGWDTACKLLILANFGLGADLALDDLSVGGIQNVTRAQMEEWRAAGLVPKLVGHLARSGDGLHAGVELRTYPASDAFALVQGKNKAIRVTTDAMGEILAVGCGPEPMATAAAALKDLEHILMRRR
ncbi:homoserine dehydrogenase [Muricoccus pecuniae]|uniref:Homoserine dehydrogenase n=1 Tax=Muricoccus pecuniae TaxID=693023 RepID=A0A840YAT6_9PROT|nr:homoserine dehydrogenase [Roseomonas pecuniae]MBB5695819.1 homoserine dehydrogenase [Roseomonas pecuniae]